MNIEYVLFPLMRSHKGQLSSEDPLCWSGESFIWINYCPDVRRISLSEGLKLGVLHDWGCFAMCQAIVSLICPIFSAYPQVITEGMRIQTWYRQRLMILNPIEDLIERHSIYDLIVAGHGIPDDLYIWENNITVATGSVSNRSKNDCPGYFAVHNKIVQDEFRFEFDVSAVNFPAVANLLKTMGSLLSPFPIVFLRFS